MSPNEIRAKFPNASEDFIRANTGVAVDPLPGALVQREQGKTLERAKEGGPASKAPDWRGSKPRGKRGPVLRVTLVAFTRQTIDGDNLAAGLKHVRDQIALEFGLDDAEPVVEWQYGCVCTRGEIGIAVKIETS